MTKKVISKKNKIVQAIQVTQKINQENDKHELKGLMNALNRINIKNGLILIENQSKVQTIKPYKIIIKPIWQWLLEKSH